MVTARLDSMVPANVELWMLSTFLGEHPFRNDFAFHHEPCAPESNNTKNGFLVNVFCMLSDVHVVMVSCPLFQLTCFVRWCTRPVNNHMVVHIAVLIPRSEVVLLD